MAGEWVHLKCRCGNRDDVPEGSPTNPPCSAGCGAEMEPERMIGVVQLYLLVGDTERRSELAAKLHVAASAEKLDGEYFLSVTTQELPEVLANGLLKKLQTAMRLRAGDGRRLVTFDLQSHQDFQEILAGQTFVFGETAECVCGHLPKDHGASEVDACTVEGCRCVAYSFGAPHPEDEDDTPTEGK